MYYEARDAALKKNESYHIAAFLPRRRNSPIGVNSRREFSSQFRKRYSNSRDTIHDLHAEADLILQLKEVPERICVVRFLSDGKPTMAKPCVHCQNFLRLKGVKKVKYTNWNGEWEFMDLRKSAA